MRTTHPASLLVAALVMLRHPCTRNKATAKLLLERAAENTGLTLAEREACLNLADDLDIERPTPAMDTPRPASIRPVADLDTARRRFSRPCPGLRLAPDTKGLSA